MPDNEILIGVDGGATEVKAYEVLVRTGAGSTTLALGPATALRRYEVAPGFAPVSLAQQIQDFKSGALVTTPAEREQGDRWIAATARAILTVIETAFASSARVAVCVPGLKTVDGRGLVVVKNGPRIPDYLDRLGPALLPRARVLGSLADDGEAGGWGEEVDPRGHFRGVKNAYYLGGGTGLAEALKVDGRIVTFGELRGAMERAWSMKTSRGVGFEEILSARGLNETWALRAGLDPAATAQEFPEQRAASGDAIAAEVLREGAEALLELIASRAAAWEKLGFPLERVVLGQRLARIYGGMSLHGPGSELVVVSMLRAAPALGAVAIALAGQSGAALRPLKAPWSV